jgi:hypothetical protein
VNYEELYPIVGLLRMLPATDQVSVAVEHGRPLAIRHGPRSWRRAVCAVWPSATMTELGKREGWPRDQARDYLHRLVDDGIGRVAALSSFVAAPVAAAHLDHATPWLVLDLAPLGLTMGAVEQTRLPFLDRRTR